jgi:purine-cytosine permease-like protein
VLLTGGAATLMALRPLGVVRGYLKRVAVWVVLASTAYLFVQVLRRPLPPLGGGSWTAFWKSVDVVVALPISWLPLAADYTRHSRNPRDAFAGTAVGYGLATMAYFALGVLATATGVAGDDVIASLLALPAGGLALLVLVVDEVDEVFANVYSTVVSAQNLHARLDRRAAAVVVGVVATGLALLFDDYASYESFLLLLSSVFVPLFATFVVDYFVVRRGAWPVGEDAPARWEMVVPWVAGFVAYQLINPGFVASWASFWAARQRDVGLAPPPAWTSASLVSFVVAAALTLLVGRIRRRQPAAT